MIVMDVSAALEICFGNTYGQALALLSNADEMVMAPQLFYSEVTHALTKYVKGGYLPQNEALQCGKDAIDLIDEFYPDSDLWIEAMTEAVRLHHSSYDLFYMILARRTGATLFTLDQKLQTLCLENGVNCLFLCDLPE